MSASRKERSGADSETRRRDQPSQPGAEVGPFGVIAEDARPLDTLHHHMVKSAGSIQAGLAGHDRPNEHHMLNMATYAHPQHDDLYGGPAVIGPPQARS